MKWFLSMMSSMGDILNSATRDNEAPSGVFLSNKKQDSLASKYINRISESTACRVGGVLLVLASVGLAAKDLLNNLKGISDESVFRMSEVMRHDNLQNGLPGKLAGQGFERAGYMVTVLDHDGLSPAVHVRPLNEQDAQDVGKPDEMLSLIARVLQEWRMDPVNTNRMVKLNLKFIIGADDVAGLYGALAELHVKAPKTIVTSLSVTGDEASEPRVALGDVPAVLGTNADKLQRLNYYRVIMDNLDVPPQLKSLRKLDVIYSHIGSNDGAENHDLSNSLHELNLLGSQIPETLNHKTLMAGFPALQKYTEPNGKYHILADRVAQR